MCLQISKTAKMSHKAASHTRRRVKINPKTQPERKKSTRISNREEHQVKLSFIGSFKVQLCWDFRWCLVWVADQGQEHTDAKVGATQAQTRLLKQLPATATLVATAQCDRKPQQKWACSADSDLAQLLGVCGASAHELFDWGLWAVVFGVGHG